MYLCVPDISCFYWNTASINESTPSRTPRKKMGGHQSSGARAPELCCPLCSWLIIFRFLTCWAPHKIFLLESLFDFQEDVEEVGAKLDVNSSEIKVVFRKLRFFYFCDWCWFDILSSKSLRCLRTIKDALKWKPYQQHPKRWTVQIIMVSICQAINSGVDYQTKLDFGSFLGRLLLI